MVFPHPSLVDFPHPTFSIDAAQHMVPPTHELFALAKKLAGQGTGIAGFDSIAQNRALRAVQKALGLPTSWGTCPTCQGTGGHPDERAARARWKPRKPPRGKGYQLWDDESPLSPVFKTLDELAGWCAAGTTTFGAHRATREKWAAMLKDGFVHHREGSAVFY